jgi:hypothetical protein
MAKKRKTLSRVEWEFKLNLRAWKDPDFRKLLKVDPQKALKEIGCPKSINPKTIRFVEEEKDMQVVVLHKKPTHGLELAEADLRNVAGGCTITHDNASWLDSWAVGC